MLEFAIKLIVKTLLGLTTEHWKFALNMVIKLAQDKAIASNNSRAQQFLAYFMTWYGTGEETAANIRFLAVKFARHKKLIPYAPK